MSLILVITVAACKEDVDSRSFKEARDTFETQLTKKVNNQYGIPTPPAGIFDLISYQSTVGDLAAYISSDPTDGLQHPLIIWVVGGWSNGISSIPWSYPDWENDQTGSAFREAGVLMMYPSFRGANGNPGYQETLFGEINDIVAAYEYAKTLPYVDPHRIYLGGHSTGGTRTLLASAYTDVFRAVFSFGPVDEIKNHNRSQFTFDLNNKEESKLRSPVYWLKDIKTPTFIMEGQRGNASELKNIEKNAKDNRYIHSYVISGGDHFDILAPITRLVAQKILNDTGVQSNIAISQQELQSAMKQPPITPMPTMVPFHYEVANIRFLKPAIWNERAANDQSGLIFHSEDYMDEDNFWDTSSMYLALYSLDEELSYQQFVESIDFRGTTPQGQETVINGQTAYILSYEDQEDFNTIAAFQKEGQLTIFFFELPKEYKASGTLLFDSIINSVVIG